ncbi:winged helix domain-containing protein [Celeribacter marinus]|uniref:winged helix domain-containing protein n=1 Tax=Celeribacter marinus TaxID=1397108 RepID=UPI003F6A6F43
MTINQRMGKARFTAQTDTGRRFEITIKGRKRWALERLIDAGPQGCTPITEPAPRWSGYIFDLRKLGVDIETVEEEHGGTFAGSHGRYVLRTEIVGKAVLQ